MSLHTDMDSFRANHPGAEAEQLAEMFVRRATKADLQPLVAAEFWRMEREEIRAVESRMISQAAQQSPLRVGRGEQSAAAFDGLRDLLDKPYRCRGTEQRLLRYMTREEHQARLDMLIAHRNGVDRSIEIHREALRLIEAAHVTCLDEIGELPVELAAAA